MSFPNVLMNFYLEARGFDRIQLGVFHASSQLGGAVMLPVALIAFRRIGRRAALVGGAGWAATARLLTLLPLPFEGVIAFEAISGLGTVLYSLASVSLLADATHRANRAQVYGAADGLRTLAVLFGSVTAGALPGLAVATLGLTPERAEGYRAALLLAFLVRLAGVGILWGIVRQPASESGLPEIDPLRWFSPPALLRLRIQLYALALPLVALLFSEALVQTFLNLFLRERYGLSDLQIGTLLGASAAMSAGAALAASPLSARHGERALILVFGIATAGIVTLLSLTQASFAGALLILAQACATQVLLVLYRVYVINSALREEYFIISTLIAISANIGPTISPIVGGWIQQALGFSVLFLVAAAATAAATALFAGVTVAKLQARLAASLAEVVLARPRTGRG